MNAAPWRLDYPAPFGMQAGSDMRPTLLRVLTELYLQKPTHTADEERHYTELALRLLDGVDAGTRAIVAERLARHPLPPKRVIERLAADLPEVAAHMAAHVVGPALPRQSSPGVAAQWRKMPPAPPFPADVARELNELFFAANADERRLILSNLDLIAPFPAGPLKLAPASGLGERLEIAILSRNREAFAQLIAHALQISRAQARRLADDDLGEPIVTAAKAINIGRGPLYRMLLFVNMRIGDSVARVQALAELHHKLPMQAAQQMVAIWQSLPNTDRLADRHRPLLSDDKIAHRQRTNAAAPLASSNSRPAERRGAS
jgi:hypothetical protein